jgi:hypothetical protein
MGRFLAYRSWQEVEVVEIVRVRKYFVESRKTTEAMIGNQSELAVFGIRRP